MNSDRLAHSKITKKFRTDDRQLLFSRGEGGTVWDALGRSYLDFVMGYGPVIIGHAKEYNAQICEQLGHGMMMPGYSEFHERYLDHMLRDRPGDRGAFFKTASEAVTAALRLAAMENGRLGVIRTGYVGWHDSRVANSLKWHEPQHSPFREQLRYTQAGGDGPPGDQRADRTPRRADAGIDQHVVRDRDLVGIDGARRVDAGPGRRRGALRRQTRRAEPGDDQPRRGVSEEITRGVARTASCRRRACRT